MQFPFGQLGHMCFVDVDKTFVSSYLFSACLTRLQGWFAFPTASQPFKVCFLIVIEPLFHFLTHKRSKCRLLVRLTSSFRLCCDMTLKLKFEGCSDLNL